MYYMVLSILSVFDSYKYNGHLREGSGSEVECLTQDRKAAGSSLTGVTALCPWARHINPSLVLVQPRKTRPYITERLLMGRKESNQTNNGHLFCIAVITMSIDIINIYYILFYSNKYSGHLLCITVIAMATMWVTMCYMVLSNCLLMLKSTRKSIPCSCTLTYLTFYICFVLQWSLWKQCESQCVTRRYQLVC